MKPYGYIGTGKCKKWDLGYEDVVSIQIAGRKSSIGHLPTKSGEYKSYTRNSKTRKANRRYFNKVARRINFENFE